MSRAAFLNRVLRPLVAAACLLPAGLPLQAGPLAVIPAGPATPAKATASAAAPATAAALLAATPPAKREALFKRVMSELDQNGDLLLYINTMDLVQVVMKQVEEIVSVLPLPEGAATAPKDYVTRLDAFLRQNGFYSIEAFGLSFVPRPDGLHDVKSFVARDPATVETPLWRMFGGKPRPLATLNCLPGDTAVAQVANLDLREAWKCLREGITQVAGEPVLADMDRALQNVQMQAGIDVNALLNAMGDEAFFSLQLSETAEATIPLGEGQELKIPQPGLICGFTLRQPAAVQAMLEALTTTARDPQGNPQFVKIPAAAGLMLYATAEPIPAPIPLQPTFAVFQNLLFVGSTAKAINSAVAAMTAKNGLIANAAFLKSFGGKVGDCNGISYVSERFSQALQKVYSTLASSKAEQGAEEAASMRVMEKVYNLLGASQSSGIRTNKPDGMAFTGISAQGGRQVVIALAVFPIGILAGVALPAIAGARGAARNNGCINNLRQIDGAKEQWALENNQDEGATPTMDDLVGPDKWLPVKPVCPQGGKYKVNPIGTAPACSIPGHEL